MFDKTLAKLAEKKCQLVLKPELESESPGGLTELQIAGPSPRAAGSVVLGWSLKMSVWNRLPDDAHSAGGGAARGNHRYK